MVFAGIYPVEGDDYQKLRDALEKLKLNDASLVYEPENSVALGFGFRCGFLGLLHMEIVQERLEREYDLNLLTTAPSVEYQVTKTDGEVIMVDNPARAAGPRADREDRGAVDGHLGDHAHALHRRADGAGDHAARRRSETMDYLEEDRVHLTYRMPLAELIVDFYDQLKSRTQGYASLDYHVRRRTRRPTW